MKTCDDSKLPEDNDTDIDGDVDNDGRIVIEQQYQLDAPVGKVWRAISVPALRDHWLPGLDLASSEPVHTVPGQEVRYIMRERQPPFIESQVSLHIRPASDGGTVLTIVHAVRVAAEAANDSGGVYMLAA